MKYQTYKYQKDGVELSFSFAEDEKINDNKKAFLELLEKAVEDLTKKITN
jgi:hypothetical protein